MYQRQAERTKHRAPCTVTIGGRRHNGFLIDYSTSGMFIQTSASPKVGERLDIEVTLRGQRMPMHVEVARRRAVPAQLRSVAGGGIGVRILSAPESFYALIAADREARVDEAVRAPEPPPRARAPVSSALPAPAAASPTAPRQRFRVRLRATRGNRSRSLEIEAGSEREARERALKELGDDWKILEIQPAG